MRARTASLIAVLAVAVSLPAIARSRDHGYRGGYQVEWHEDGWYYPPVRIQVAPPPPVLEMAPPCPYPGAVWIAGYYAWHPSRHHFVWVPGAWYRPPHPRWVWIAPTWQFQTGQWVFMPGYWQDSALGPPDYPPPGYAPPGYPPPGYPGDGAPPPAGVARQGPTAGPTPQAVAPAPAPISGPIAASPPPVPVPPAH